ncbi:protein PIR [Citrus sinensis]|uniref:Protein PIR n=1 Tax=Citrus sinensis TaxID=2711 RepID=A0ACB8MFN4_CITSI|nr:protein PIR [Citrus sinensis]
MRNGHGEKSVWRRSSRAHSLRFWGQSNLNSKRNRQFAIHVMAAVPVEEAIAALSTFSLEDEQPEVQGPSVLVSTERGATASPIEYSDVNAYRLSLSEDTKALNQLNTLIQEGKEMASVLYTYRSCVKALPQLPNSMKHSQADLYLETYQVLDLEMSRLREIQRWQASAASKLAADMQRFSRPERRINGPTITHLWSMLKLLDVLVQLDHLKNAKASIPNDFSWYKRTFTQVSVQWQDTDSMREELDDLQIFLSTRWAILLNLHVEMFRVNNVEDILQVLIVFAVESLELDFALLFPERHILLRVLPVLVVLATSSEKDSESLYKRVKINRLINIFKLLLLKSTDNADIEWCKEVKGNMYDMVIEGFQLLSKWTARIWEQCAWKFSRPYKDAVPSETNEASASYSDYEKVVRYNYSAEERKALVELVSYIKNIGSMMLRSDTLVADALWETIHAEVQDFVQNTLATMLRTTFRKKKDLSRQAQFKDIPLLSWLEGESILDLLLPIARARPTRILSDMRTLSADWMANNSRPEAEQQSMHHVGEESRGNIFYPRAVAPTAAQVHCLQFLIYEVVSGGNLRKPGGLFGNTGSEIPVNELKQLESFFYKLSFFLHILDYTATVSTLTDLGFLWFREFYLESSRVIQFPIECSLPWMLVDHVLESQNAGLLESVMMPFDIYNDSAQQALVVLKQRFLYDEIEAEVDHCFDIFVSRLCETIFTYYKSWAASELLDPSFLFSSDNGEKYSVQPMRLSALFKMTRVKRFIRSSKVPLASVQKPSVPYAKPSFYCGTQITTLEPLIMGLQETLPKSIGLLHFDSGVTGCMRLVKEQLNWGTKSELKAEVLHGIKEIGSVLYWMGLLDIVLREVDTTHFMQTAPWLGFLPGADGQISYHQDGGDSPVVNLFKSATAAIVSNPGCPNPTSFHTMSKQAEAADLLYKANMNTGSVLEYALAFTSAALDKYCSKWSATPKTGFIDITTSKDFYRIYSELNLRVGDRYQGYLEESSQTPSNNHKVLGDSVAWGGCTIIYLLGQQLHFELFDFSYQVLNVAEVEAISVPQSQKHPHFGQGWEALIEAMKKARRLNNHVFSMLKARCPLEDKTACAIKQSGAPLHRIKFENTVSAFETLPQRGVHGFGGP